MESIIEVRHLSKSFGDNQVLRDINFSVDQGQVVTIIGASGSGKSTLLRCINLLEDPTGGEIIYRGKNILEDDHDATSYRAHIGMVFQSFNLFNNMDVLHNCTVGPVKVKGESFEVAKEKALKYLEHVGMAQYINARPAQLSGGQQQRVAIARALVNSPAVLLADEPSGNLDTRNKEEVHRLFFDLRERLGQTIVLVTHDESLALRADRRIVMSDGLILPE